MARELRWWVGGAILSCLVVGVAYLPPRGGQPEPRVLTAALKISPARVRAQAITAEWREADLELRLAEYRQQLSQSLAQAADSDAPGHALLLDLSDTVPSVLVHSLRSAVDRAWTDLNVRSSKVKVGVVIHQEDIRSTKLHFTAAYLLPDSTDRSTCVAVLEIESSGILFDTTQNSQFAEFLKSEFGPCAFYAAFGAPGPAVRSWLSARGFDLALSTDWSEVRSANWRPWSLPYSPRERLFWERLYSYPLDAAACIGGRMADCRSAVLAEAGSILDSIPRVVVSAQSWWREERLVGADRFLADAVRDLGPDRFQRFWSSTLDVDTAFAAAAGMPIDKWTQRWEASVIPVVRFGPHIAPAPEGLGLLLTAGCFGFVALTVRRRQVG